MISSAYSAVIRLGDLCAIQSGGTPSRSENRYWGSGIPWAKISDIERSNGILTQTEEQITNEGLAAIRGRIFSEGTVLFAIYGSVGKLAVAGREVSANQAILGITVHDERTISPRYLVSWLRSQQSRFELEANGVAQRNLSAGYVRDLMIPLPDITEQRRIADILDQADALRRKQQEADRLADDLVKASFGELMAKVPEPEDGVPIGDIVDDNVIGLVRGSEEISPDREFEYLKMDQIGSDGWLEYHGKFRVDASPAEVQRYSIRDGDVLFNTRNTKELVGKTGIAIDPPKNLLLNNNIMRLRFKNAFSQEYVWAYLNSQHGKRQLEARKSGTTSVFAVYQKALFTVRVPEIPIDDQRRFASLLRSVASIKCQQVKAIAAAEDSLRSLSSEYFG